MCIGDGFAMLEVKIILAILLQRFRLELASGEFKGISARWST